MSSGHDDVCYSSVSSVRTSSGRDDVCYLRVIVDFVNVSLIARLGLGLAYSQ